MALDGKKLPKKQGDRVEQPNIEPGVYPARIVQVIDFGLQPQRPYQGQEKKPVNEVGFTYELVDTFMIDKDGNEVEDKPRWISETLPWYGLDADKAKSVQRYNAADPNGVFEGNLALIVDTPVNVSIVNNKSGDKIYDNIASIAAMRPRDAAKVPELKNPPKVFDLDDPDMEVFGSFPQWIQDKIKGNLNFEGSLLQKRLNGDKPVPKKEVKKEEVDHDIDREQNEDVDPNDVPW